MIGTVAIIVSSRPFASDDEMTFRTFRGYLQAVCAWSADLYPHTDGLLPGVADAVKAQPWRSSVRPGRHRLGARAAEVLRNGWATEILLNSPRVLGGPDIVAFSNLWAPVQAYYAVFESFTALAMTIGTAPRTHASLLEWAAANVAHSGTPFVVPWTARVGGAPGAWTFEGFGSVTPDPSISNLSAPHATNAPHLLALALKTTRQDQIDERRERWRSGLKTKRGTPRKSLPTAVLLANAAKMRATTLFDLLWRLRVRSNYKEGDALLSGALGPTDAAGFHNALSEIVAATLLTTEIYLARVVGAIELKRCAMSLSVPPSLEEQSVRARLHLW